MGERLSWGKRGWYQIRDGLWQRRLPGGREIEVERKPKRVYWGGGAGFRTLREAMYAAEKEAGVE